MGTSPSTTGLAVIRRMARSGSDGSSRQGPEKSPSRHFSSLRNSSVRSALKRGNAGMIGMALPLPKKLFGTAPTGSAKRNADTRERSAVFIESRDYQKRQSNTNRNPLRRSGGISSFPALVTVRSIEDEVRSLHVPLRHSMLLPMARLHDLR